MLEFLYSWWIDTDHEIDANAAKIIVRNMKRYHREQNSKRVLHSVIQMQRRFRRNRDEPERRSIRRRIRKSIYGNEFCLARDLRILLKHRSRLYSEIQEINDKINREYTIIP